MQRSNNDAELETGVNNRLNGQGWHNSIKMELIILCKTYIILSVSVLTVTL